jgi:DmsE family decaheme c-type cytochrome
MRYGRKILSKSLLIGFALWSLAWALLTPRAALALQTQQATSETADASQYVGSEVCQACHDELFSSFEETPHWKTTLDTRRGPAWQGCEACHGPGAEHVAGGGDRTKIFTFRDASPRAATTRCLGCHEYGQEHSNFERSQHNNNDVSCIACHSPHFAKQPQFLLAENQPALCYSCHLETKVDFAKPVRHRVNENLVKCTDCHNQHGGFLTNQLRATASQDVVCFQCHVEKAGPFVFEHQPVKTEGCVACHTPHGSSNPRLLKRSQVNLLCLECHTLTVDSPVPGIPSFHNQAQKYQACTLCHTNIHGSNSSNVFFK